MDKFGYIYKTKQEKRRGRKYDVIVDRISTKDFYDKFHYKSLSLSDLTYIIDEVVYWNYDVWTNFIKSFAVDQVIEFNKIKNREENLKELWYIKK